MIKRLRTKFVCVIMSIVAVLLVLVLGVVIGFTGSMMELQSESMMRNISSGSFHQGSPGGPADEIRLPFFILETTLRGEIIDASGGYFDLSDREYLVDIVTAAMNAKEETGLLRQENLRWLKTRTPGGYTLVFADTTSENATMRNLVYTCLLIFCGAMAVFLWISVRLSRWAIHPVEEAWDQQRQFVADASHELKTPLAVIMANAELLHSEETAPAERQTFSKNILAMTYQMRSLVESMLEMARVDNGAVKTAFASVDLSQIVTDSVLSVQLLYEEKGLGLQSEIAGDLYIQGSESHLYQVLDVLLDNALKYSAPGTVRVTLTPGSRNCLLRVDSPGTPLSGEELKHIFKRFYRGDKVRSMNGSYGLGLSIAERIVTDHKGKIWAESSEDGNHFFVQLPLLLHHGK